MVGLWMSPFLLAHLGQKAFGLWAAGLPTLLYVGLLDFGVMGLLQREVAFLLGAAAAGEAAKTLNIGPQVGKTVRLVLWQWPVLCVVAGLTWHMLPPTWAPLRLPLLVVLAALATSFPLRTAHAILIGFQDLAFIGQLTFAFWILTTLISVLMVLSGCGLYALACSWAFSQVVSSIICCIRVAVCFPLAIPRQLPQLSLIEARRILGQGLWVTIQQLAYTLLNGTDVLVVAGVLGPAAATPYVMTDKLLTLSGNVPLQIVMSGQPALNEIRAAGDMARVSRVMNALSQAVLVTSGLVATVVIAVDRGFVAWWVGTTQFAGLRVVVALACAALLGHWVAATGSGLFALGRERLYAINLAATGTVTLALALWLTRSSGLLGAPVASILGYSLIALPTNIIALARATETPTFDALRAVASWAWRFALLVCAAVISSHVWKPASLAAVVATAAGFTIAYAAIMMPVLTRGPLSTYVRPRVFAARTLFTKRLKAYSGR